MKKLLNIKNLFNRKKVNKPFIASLDAIEDVNVNNIKNDDFIEVTIDIGDWRPTKVLVKKDYGKERNKKITL